MWKLLFTQNSVRRKVPKGCWPWYICFAVCVYVRKSARKVYKFPLWEVCVAVWMSNTKMKPHTHMQIKLTHTHTYMYETRTTTKVASVCKCIVRLSYAEDGLKDYIFIIFLSLFFAWLRSTEGKNAKIQYLNAFKSKPTLSVSLYLHRGNSLPRVTDFRFPLSLMQHLYRIVCLASIW